MGLLHFSDNEKIVFSLSLTLCNMLGANMFGDLVVADAAAIVYPCRPNPNYI